MSVDSLGISTPKNMDPGLLAIGWTISIRDQCKVPVSSLRNKKLYWGTLTPSQQYSYLSNTYIPTVVNRYVTQYECHFELNKRGNVHAHLLVYIQSHPGHEEYDLRCLQKSVSQNRLVVSMASISTRKHLNYIHMLNDINEWTEYIRKDDSKSPMEPLSFERNGSYI